MSRYRLQDPEARIFRDFLDPLISRKGARTLIEAVNEQGEMSRAQFRFQLRSLIQADNALPLSSKHIRVLRAAVGLGDRLSQDLPFDGEILESPSQVASVFFQLIGWSETEQAAVLIVDVRQRFLAAKVIGIGDLHSVIIPATSLFRAVLQHNGAGCMVAHSHPSGDTTPSEDDLAATRTLIKAGSLLGITVHDHLVIGRGQFSSIREQHPTFWN
ncbi:MAG: JAB domain-containing protein [Cyanobacteria bacterium J06638_22]